MTHAEIFKPDFLGLFKSQENLANVKAGDTLFHKGDSANCMYVVLSGELKIGNGNNIYEVAGAGRSGGRNCADRSCDARRDRYGGDGLHLGADR